MGSRLKESAVKFVEYALNMGGFLDQRDVHRDLFNSSCEETGLQRVAAPNQDKTDDISQTENVILQFSIDVHLPVVNVTQCIPFINDAQVSMKQGAYGAAIARFKDVITYVQKLPFTDVVGRMTVGDVIFVKSLAHERISFCQLLKSNPFLAVKHAHLSISEHSSNPQIHLWRSIAYRRLDRVAEALKSMTLFVGLSAACGGCNHGVLLQKVIHNYWRRVFERTQSHLANIKIQYFPLHRLNSMTGRQQSSAMSETQLVNHPEFNCLIHADTTEIHLVPCREEKGYLEGGILCKQAFSFRDASADCLYFSKLSSRSTSHDVTDRATAKLDIEQVKKIWETAVCTNCTKTLFSLVPGREIHEHHLYCLALTKAQKWKEAVSELEATLADLSIFPLISEKEWSQALSLEVEACADKICDILQTIKHGMNDELEANVHIHGTKLWLEHCERKFRARKSKQAQLCQQMTKSKHNKTPSGREAKSGRKLFGKR